MMRMGRRVCVHKKFDKKANEVECDEPKKKGKRVRELQRNGKVLKNRLKNGETIDDFL